RALDSGHAVVLAQANCSVASQVHAPPGAGKKPGIPRKTEYPGATAPALPDRAGSVRCTDPDGSPRGLRKPRKSPPLATRAARSKPLRSMTQAPQPLPAPAECSHCCFRLSIEPAVPISGGQSLRDSPANNRRCESPHQPRKLPFRAAALSCMLLASTAQPIPEVPILLAAVQSERSWDALHLPKTSKR